MTPFSRSLAIVAVSVGVVATSIAPASARGWRGGGYHHGHGGAVAAGLFGALAIGAIAAGAASAAPGECVLERRPLYNSFGKLIGHRTVRVCD